MRAALFVTMTLFLAACGPQTDVTLEWPTLNTLDVAVEELDGMLEQNVAAEQLAKRVSEVTTALDAVVKGGIPTGAENQELVQQKLTELASLQTELQTASTTENKEVLHALHPLVASIMETAGMPHVHACAGCAGCSGSKEHKDHDHAAHSHEEHDHAHGEHSHEGHGDHDH